MAATEIYRANHRATYKAAADRRAGQLMRGDSLQPETWKDYWRADAGTRPFAALPMSYGLPVVSLA